MCLFIRFAFGNYRVRRFFLILQICSIFFPNIFRRDFFFVLIQLVSLRFLRRISISSVYDYVYAPHYFRCYETFFCVDILFRVFSLHFSKERIKQEESGKEEVRSFVYYVILDSITRSSLQTVFCTPPSLSFLLLQRSLILFT